MPEKSNSAALALTLQFPDKRLRKQLTTKVIKNAVQAALITLAITPAEITLRFVAAEEGRTLNRQYRGKDYATNVLTFSYHADHEFKGIGEITQADIVLCTDVLQEEAAEQNKSVIDHTLHLIIHGVLHAQGYDHESEEDAAEMEQLEVQILASLGVKNPYDTGPGFLGT